MLQRRLAGNEEVKTNGREGRSLTERLEPERKEGYRAVPKLLRVRGYLGPEKCLGC